MNQNDAVVVDAVCPQCESTYYRSVRPLVVGRDKLTPELFAPVVPGTPPPNAERPECPTCRSTLRFVRVSASESPESPLPPLSPPAPERFARKSASVEVLFEVQGDEQVLDIRSTEDSYLVVTNRRILKVAY